MKKIIVLLSLLFLCACNTAQKEETVSLLTNRNEYFANGDKYSFVEYVYNEVGDLIGVNTHEYSEEELPITEYTFNCNGELLVCDRKDTNGNSISKTAFLFDDENDYIGYIGYENGVAVDTETITKTIEGNATTRIYSYHFEDEDGVDEYSIKEIEKVDDNGNLIQIISFDEYGNISFIFNYEYEGDLLVHEYVTDTEGTVLDDTTYEYNANKDLTKKREEMSIYEETSHISSQENEYDSNNNLIKTTEYRDDELDYYFVYEYENGKLVKASQYTEKDVLFFHYVNEYEGDNLIKTSYYDSNNELYSYAEYIYKEMPKASYKPTYEVDKQEYSYQSALYDLDYSFQWLY